MSWWWVSEAEERGRRELSAIDVDPLLAVCVIAFPMILLVVNGLLSWALFAVGLACLIVAKISLFRRGIWVSWGPTLMSARAANIYKLAYVLLVAGAFVRLVLRA
jgi:hypothetical protein